MVQYVYADVNPVEAALSQVRANDLRARHQDMLFLTNRALSRPTPLPRLRKRLSDKPELLFCRRYCLQLEPTLLHPLDTPFGLLRGTSTT